MKFVQSVSTMGVTAIAVSLMDISNALADAGPQELPEPSMLGLFAVGVIGAIAVSACGNKVFGGPVPGLS